MIDTNEKISQAKAKLLVNHPFFGTLASRVELVLNNNLQAFKSNGSKLEYNGDFFQNITSQEMLFVLANSAMHAALAHENRKLNRSGWLWQMATDLAINDMLVQNGFELPHGAQYRKRFEGMYAEEIYAELQDDILREDEGLEYEADEADEAGDVKQQENTKKQTEVIIQEEIMQEHLLAEETISLLERSLQNGELPQSMERFFQLEYIGKIDWRHELKNAIDKFYRDDFVLIPPNKKFLHMGIYLPSATSNTVSLTIAVDSSGSVDDKLLNEFLSEVSFLMLNVQNYKIDLLVCDDKIHSHSVFFSGDNLVCELKGGGGTDFRPVFEFIQSELQDTNLLLYFSDLEGLFPHAAPSYDVKWVSPKERDVPFGEIILL